METQTTSETTPDSSTLSTNIQLISFSPDLVEEHQVDNLDRLPELLNRTGMVHWLNVDRVDDVPLIQRIGAMFKLHSLALEDVNHIHQRSKVEEYEGYLFVVVRMAAFEDNELATEQLSLFIRENWVITFQEGRPGDCLGSVRDRISRANSQTRRSGSDFLMYQILDASIDSYYLPLEQIGERLDELENFAESPHVHGRIEELHHIRRSLLTMWRAIWPLRDALSTLLHTNFKLVTAETRFHLRDCQDHTVQLIDVSETMREVCTDLRDLLYANINQRTNEVIRVLTIIATIFLPLSFIASVYGMNFNTDVSGWNMPELNWPFGYFFALSIMAIVAIAMVITFWRWGWIGRQSDLD